MVLRLALKQNLAGEAENLVKQITPVVEKLREKKFLEGTRFAEKALEQGLEPYSFLLGVLVGIGLTLVFGLLTVEYWLPKAIAKVTGKSIEEVMKALRETSSK